MTKTPIITDQLFGFLSALARNNDREWFRAHKTRYEHQVKQPLLDLIGQFGPELHKLSPHFVADPRPVGGSLFRIHRDTRFSKDKSPYKTNAGVQFRHQAGKDVHAPGFYLHLAPGEVFAAAGIWRPDRDALSQIRAALLESPDEWRRIVGAKRFRTAYRLAGDALKRPPRGIDPEHPLVEDLKRKDFIALAELSQEAVCAPTLIADLRRLWARAAPLTAFLCRALGLPF